MLMVSEKWCSDLQSNLFTTRNFMLPVDAKPWLHLQTPDIFAELAGHIGTARRPCCRIGICAVLIGKVLNSNIESNHKCTCKVVACNVLGLTTIILTAYVVVSPGFKFLIIAILGRYYRKRSSRTKVDNITPIFLKPCTNARIVPQSNNIVFNKAG